LISLGLAGSKPMIDFMDHVSSGRYIGRKGNAGRLETAEIYFTAGNVSSNERTSIHSSLRQPQGFFQVWSCANGQAISHCTDLPASIRKSRPGYQHGIIPRGYLRSL
jgi:hypothetical protein